MHQKPNPWTGRIDGETEEHFRWHQTITMGDIEFGAPDFGIIGFVTR